MTIDWKKAAVRLKREVCDRGGFLTISKDALRERFGIGRLKVNNSEELSRTLKEYGMFVFPHPHKAGLSLRVYDVESEIGKIALAVTNQGLTDRALEDAVKLQARANAGKDRRSDDVSWLSAFDVFLQIVIRRPPEGWEILDDECNLHQLADDLAKSLELADEIAHANETVQIAGAVCACRPRVPRWEGESSALPAILEEAASKQKDIFDGLLRAAAKHLLGEPEIPSRKVKLGRLGLRYCREAKGGIGWLR